MTNEELKNNKKFLLIDFLVDLVKYPLLFFIIVYVSAYALANVFISHLPQLCEMSGYSKVITSKNETIKGLLR